MVDKAEVNVEKREELGSNQVHTIRKEGAIPGIVYGQEEDAVPVTIERTELFDAFKQETYLYELQINGETQVTKLQDIQWDSLGEEVLHVDFERVSLDQEIEVEVPLETVGSSTVLEGTGAYMEQHIRLLPIRCLPKNIPTEIPVSIDGLEIGDTIHVRDLILPPGVSAVLDEHRLVVSVHEAQELSIEEEEEEFGPTALEPELVGEDEEEELEEGELEEGEEAPAPADEEGGE